MRSGVAWGLSGVSNFMNGRGKFMVECGCGISLIDPCPSWGWNWLEESDEMFETIDGRGKFIVEFWCGKFLIDSSPNGSEDVWMRSGVAWGLSGVSKCS